MTQFLDQLLADVLLEIRQSNDQIDRSLAALAQLDLEETSKGMKKVEKEIKTLYRILEKEYKARPFVEKNQDKLQRLLTCLLYTSDAADE